jgi:formylglycine-generating enzyme required for sulfatase activity
MAAGPDIRRRVELAPGVGLDLMRVPAGEFLMGDCDSAEDEQPVSAIRIAQPFWMARWEINNAQFACFDPTHDSRVEDKNTYQFGIHGYPANEAAQPVVRVSWQEAMAFCRWLSDRTGQRFSLPTEAQWEWACRAGASTPFSFGPRDTDFSGHANFADSKLREFASDPYTVDKPLADATPYDDWIPKDARFNDGALIAVAPGRFAANAWGLHDLHGNVAEWTRSIHASYPWAVDGRDDVNRAGRRTVRGGSWRDVPARGTASFRLDYEPWQRVYNVGFRVVCESELKDTKTTADTAGIQNEKVISAR